jgi:NAD-dependent SIR2 family protein deacetylase
MNSSLYEACRCQRRANGYEETIGRGMAGLRHFRGSRLLMEDSAERDAQTERLKAAIADAEKIVIGAGAGLSTSAGYVYNGERFQKYFGDFAAKYGYRDMYSGGFYRYPSEEERWAFWSRNIYINRYMDPPKPVYDDLLALVKDKDYFVITTNVDHCFQRTGFDKKRLFYTQGDYGLWQCSKPCHDKTYDNEEVVKEMLLAQGFTIAADGTLELPCDEKLRMAVPSDLIPRCPVCGAPMSMNLRADDTFVEDQGWYDASAAYAGYLKTCEGKRVLYLELGVGGNTPMIIKYPFWVMTYENEQATYACLNYEEACCPEKLKERSILIGGDTGEVLWNA